MARMIAMPPMTRVPAAESGVTIGDFVIPVRIADRISARARDVALVVAGALLVALTAQLTIVQAGQVVPLVADFRIRLADSPVPITGQTFGVLLVGGALGFRRGAASLALYVLLGFFLPVYAGGASGVERLAGIRDGTLVLGATGGYLIGFVAAAGVVGRLAELGWDRRLGGALAAMLLGNAVIYLFGLPWLMLATGMDLPTAVAKGLTPFLVGDAVKLALAGALFPAAWWVVGRRPSES